MITINILAESQIVVIVVLENTPRQTGESIGQFSSASNKTLSENATIPNDWNV